MQSTAVLVAAFVTRLSPDGNGTDDLVYSTFFGGSDEDWSLALDIVGPDGIGDVIVAGPTISDDLATSGAYDTTYEGGPIDSFIVRIDLCPADLDDDGIVGILDFLALLAAWGEVGVPADLDGGGVGITDFLILLGEWGPCL
jgi:hypothetical protein